jgi:hypothetical protein
MGIFDEKTKELAEDRIAEVQRQKNAQEIYLAKKRMVNNAMDIFLKNDLPAIMREYVSAAEKAHTCKEEFRIQGHGYFSKGKTIIAYYAGRKVNTSYDENYTKNLLYLSKQLKLYENNYIYSKDSYKGIAEYFYDILPSIYNAKEFNSFYGGYDYYKRFFYPCNPLYEINSIDEMLESLNAKFREYLLTCL